MTRLFQNSSIAKAKNGKNKRDIICLVYLLNTVPQECNGGKFWNFEILVNSYKLQCTL